MQTVQTPARISVDEYLTGEQRSEVRHEYLGGDVYAMAGSSTDHNLISSNLLVALRSHLRGTPCQVFMVDVKVRLEVAGEDIFYYPDLMVACDPRDRDPYFKQFPKILIEVLSEATERTDRREKFLSYIQIPTLEEYVLVAQDRREVTVFRRGNQWRPEVQREAVGSFHLNSIDLTLPFDLAYEGLKA
jgi:Uma2 family endonuclease